jgi:hypothetical protein
MTVGEIKAELEKFEEDETIVFEITGSEMWLDSITKELRNLTPDTKKEFVIFNLM